MEIKKYFDNLNVKLQDVVKPDHIPFLGGRPDRITIISKEDIQNLTIELNRDQGLDSLLAHL